MNMFRSVVMAGAVATLIAPAAGWAHSYAIDPSHTFVTFEIDHNAASTNRGRFDRKEGTIEFDRAARTGKVDISIDVRSVSTGWPAFEKHLQSADLFDAEKFPTMRFVSERFVFDGDKVSEVAGQLTLKGLTHPVVLKATKFTCYDNRMLKRDVCGGDFTAVVDRTLWGMNYGIAFGYTKEARLVVQVEAIKQ